MPDPDGREQERAQSQKQRSPRDLLGLAADIIQIGNFLWLLLGSAAVAVAFAVLLKDATLWAVVPGALLLMFVLTTLAFLIGRGQREDAADRATAHESATRDLIAALEAARDLAVEQHGVAVAHVVRLQSVIRLVRETWALVPDDADDSEAEYPDVEAIFGRLRNHVLNIVIQAIHSGKGEQVRVAFVRPDHNDDGPCMTALPSHHFGHASSYKTQPLDVRKSLAGLAYQTGVTQYAADAASDPRVEHFAHDAMGSLLCAPAFGANDSVPVGVLCVSSTRRAAFGESEARENLENPDQRFVEICAHVVVLVDYLERVLTEA